MALRGQQLGEVRMRWKPREIARPTIVRRRSRAMRSPPRHRLAVLRDRAAPFDQLGFMLHEDAANEQRIQQEPARPARTR